MQKNMYRKDQGILEFVLSFFFLREDGKGTNGDEKIEDQEYK